MIVLISYRNAPWHFYFLYLNMEKSAKKSKTSASVSGSRNKGRLRNCSVLTRSDSFSSCSTDSSIYGNSSIQTRFRSANRTPNNQSVGSRKRTRNSSGSSISSNISGISDKDLKSTGITSQTITKTEIRNYTDSNSKSPQLKYSKINSRNIQVKEKTIVNEEIDHSKNSNVLVPNHHNLRGKITRKGCTCCPSTCATVVVRRYKRYVKTGIEEETVISSTKVKTYIQKSSPPSVPQISVRNNDTECNKSRNKKRKSEVEKLYESLHEIEWAKDFSPDNILSQISVRQAAACSVFGHSHDNKLNFSQKRLKKQVIFDLDQKVNSSFVDSVHSDIMSENSCDVNSNIGKDTDIVMDCDRNQKVANLQTAQITTSDIYHCEQNCNSHSSVNMSPCSLSHMNLKEISINSCETVHTESLIMENGADDSDDAQLSYSSDESSAAVSSSIVNLQSKPLLDFGYRGKNNRNLSDTVSEFSVTPAFLDIAEEGIRTIDACFREVGAEVIVSTCYEEESPLPLLTSVKENRTLNKIFDDNPPILEPCISITYNHKKQKSLVQKCNKQLEKKKDNKCYLKMPVNNHRVTNGNYSTEKMSIEHCRPRSSLKLKNFKKSVVISKVRLNILRTAKKIVKKYFKILHSKYRPKYISQNKYKRSTCSKNKLLNISDRCFSVVNMCSELNKNKSNICVKNSVITSTFTKSHSISCCVSGEKHKLLGHEAANQDYSSSNKIENKVMLNSGKNGTCLYGKRTALCPTEIKKVSIISQTQTSTTQSISTVSASVSTEFKSANKVHSEYISRSPALYGFSCDYKSIRVNRSNVFTHVILMVTRGKSIFLTLEKLKELRDVLIRANNDSNCQVLIINGIGDSFCSGLDLTPLVGPQKNTASTEIAVAIKELIEALSDFKKPLAAVVNGPAVGLGLTLLNHADLIIASDKATFCMPYSYLGYMPEGGATLTLPQVVGSTVAMDLLLRGKTLTAREARNVGLISEVLEARRLPQELVSRVRALSENPVSALETTKAFLKMQLHSNLQLVLENEVKLLPRMWLTQTCQECLQKALKSGILAG